MRKVKSDTPDQHINDFLELIARMMARKHLHQQHTYATEDPCQDQAADPAKAKVRDTQDRNSND